MMAAQEQNNDFSKNIVSGVSCAKCPHVRVCAVIRAFSPLMGNWEEDPPIDPNDLAKICEAYGLVLPT